MYRQFFYLIILAVFIGSYGCSGLKIKRSVQDNIFYSSATPKIKIRISPEYQYIGSTESSYHSAGEGLSIDTVLYTFVRVEDNTVKKGIIIRINTLHSGIWLSRGKGDLVKWMKNKLETGDVMINGKVYDYGVQAFSRVFDKNTTNLITSKGYSISRCYMLKSLSRVTSHYREGAKIDIWYLEDASQFQGIRYSWKDWKSIDLLSISQKEFLKKYAERSLKDFQIMQ